MSASTSLRQVALSATVVVIVVYGVAFVLMLLVGMEVTPQELAGKPAIAWLMSAFLVLIGGGFLWGLVWLARWLGLNLASGNADHDRLAGAKRRRARLLRWTVVPAATCLFGAWYLEEASHSTYEVPPLRQALSASGKLDAPSLRTKFRRIVLETRNGKLVLGCEPNDRWATDCLPLDRFKALAGSEVAVAYFHYPDAFRNRNVVLHMQTSAGETVISYARQREHLLRARESGQYRTPARTIRPSLHIALIFCLILEGIAFLNAVGSVQLERKRLREQV